MKPFRRSERGLSLLAAIVVALIAGGIASAFFLLSLNQSRYADLTINGMKATYLAEAGSEEAAFQIRAAVAVSGTVPPSGSITIDGHPVDFTIATVGSSWTEIDASGLNALHQQYQIVSTATFNGSLGRVTKLVDASGIPVFQFLAFYNSDLEIQPGPTATFNGRIHTNYDMYVGANGTLTINSEYVHAVGEMYRHRKDNNAIMPGMVRVKEAGSATFTDWNPSLESTDPDWVSEATLNWNGSVQNGEMGVSVLEPPPVSSIDPGGYFHSNADLIIEDSRVLFQGSDVTGSLPAGTVSQTTIFDAREGKTVPITTIDVAKLNSSGFYPPNGLMYAYRTGTAPGNLEGVQLTNGGVLTDGLTVVSNGSVYVKGDYNTGGGNPANKQPAAVIADSVNMLSNSWSNTKNSSNGLPRATATTYNFAMITGNYESNKPGYGYNGGFENLPRFHENWSGIQCKIRGSFVNLWESQVATGAWVYGGNRYQAPNRDWDFDQDFNDPSKLPPFTPMAVMIDRTVYSEGYNSAP